MQEPVYVLHLITCHGRIMARLAELLLLYVFHSDISQMRYRTSMRIDHIFVIWSCTILKEEVSRK